MKAEDNNWLFKVNLLQFREKSFSAIMPFLNCLAWRETETFLFDWWMDWLTGFLHSLVSQASLGQWFFSLCTCTWPANVSTRQLFKMTGVPTTKTLPKPGCFWQTDQACNVLQLTITNKSKSHIVLLEDMKFWVYLCVGLQDQAHKCHTTLRVTRLACCEWSWKFGSSDAEPINKMLSLLCTGCKASFSVTLENANHLWDS